MEAKGIYSLLHHRYEGDKHEIHQKEKDQEIMPTFLHIFDKEQNIEKFTEVEKASFYADCRVIEEFVKHCKKRVVGSRVMPLDE